MTQQTRQTLYKYFGEGKLPTTEHFRDLVDSNLNMYDEGFKKTVDHGVMISTPVGKYDALISFYRGGGDARETRYGLDNKDPDAPLWSLRHGAAPTYPLQFKPGDGSGAASVLSLHAEHRVGVNTDNPAYALDVLGTVGARGRAGTYPVPQRDQILADGQWHPLTGWLDGSNGFEVVASAGGPGAGRCALMHAVALNACHPPRSRWFGFLSRPRWFGFLSRRNRIRCHNAWFGDRCEKLELQWQSQADAHRDGDPESTPAWAGNPRTYRLAIRSRCDYENGQRIEVHLTELWPCGPVAANATQPDAPSGTQHGPKESES